MGHLSPATIALHKAISDRCIESVRLAIANGADVLAFRDDGYSPLSFLDDTRILAVLLDAGANPNHAQHGQGCDILYWAASAGAVKAIEMLVSAGASVTYELPNLDNEAHGRTSSVHIASEHEHIEVMRLLLKAGGKCMLNQFDYIQRTPLMIAVERGNRDMIRLLIECGSDVNARDENWIGGTAIMRAAEEQSPEIVQILVDAGADPRITGWMGLCALSKAKDRTDADGPAIVRMLEAAASRLERVSESGSQNNVGS